MCGGILAAHEMGTGKTIQARCCVCVIAPLVGSGSESQQRHDEPWLGCWQALAYGAWCIVEFQWGPEWGCEAASEAC